MADTGKTLADQLAARLNPAGYAVAGVSIRSSSQVTFPGQLHDIKAAIRWLRANAATYGLDPERIAIVGDSSGGWTSSMAALTGDVPELEGTVGVTGVSSRVQAAVAFYPPTNFLTMDAWALNKCDPNGGMSEGPTAGHATTARRRPSRGSSAAPSSHVPGRSVPPARCSTSSAADPPMMILHGQSDQLVPHNQGESLYMALNKACRDTIFISLPKAPHGNWNGFLTDDGLREAAVMRSTSAAGCKAVNPAPFTPTWQTVIDFLDRYMKGPGPITRLARHARDDVAPGEEHDDAATGLPRHTTLAVATLAVQRSAQAAEARTIYLNPVSGRDANPGTKSAPLRTLAAAAARVNAMTEPGATTVILDEGIYAVGETALFKPNRPYSKAARLTIRAAVFLDDPDWHQGRMPTLIHTMPLSAE